MVYVTIHAYLNGNVDNVYRAIANGIQCGKPGGVAVAFPYLYFTNPFNSLDNRKCIASCPTFTSGTLSTLSCYGGSCSYDFTFRENGTTSNTVASMNSSSNILGYDTFDALGRVCLPTADVLANGLSSYAKTITSKVQ